jgi:hypothetical protein
MSLNLAGSKRAFSSNSLLLSLAKVSHSYDQEDDPSTPIKKQKIASEGQSAAQVNKSIRSKLFYRLRETLINAVKCDDDWNKERFTVPNEPFEFIKNALEVQGLTTVEADRLKEWAGRGIENWNPKDIHRNYENLFGKQYLHGEHRFGREISLFGSFLYTLLCAAYHSPKFQSLKLSVEEFEVELQALLMHHRLSESRFISKKVNMTLVDRRRLLLAWNVVRVMMKFISSRGNMEYLLFLIAVVDRSGKSYSKGTWMNMSFEAACRRLIIENEGASFQSAAAGISADRIEHDESLDEDDEDPSEESEMNDGEEQDTLSDKAVAPPVTVTTAAAVSNSSYFRPVVRSNSTNVIPHTSNYSSHKAQTMAATASYQNLVQQPVVPSPVESTSSIAHLLATKPPPQTARPLMSHLSRPVHVAPEHFHHTQPPGTGAAPAMVPSHQLLPPHHVPVLTVPSLSFPSKLGEPAPQTQDFRAYLQEYIRDKDKERMVEELHSFFLERQRLLQELADAQANLHSVYAQLRQQQRQLQLKQPKSTDSSPQSLCVRCANVVASASSATECAVAGESKLAEDVVQMFLKVWSISDSSLPSEIPASAELFLRTAEHCQLLRSGDIEQLRLHDRSDHWVSSSMDIRRLYESIFTRSYILEEHRQGREITLFTSFLYVVLCKIYHHPDFQALKLDFHSFTYELRHLKLDKCLFLNPTNVLTAASAVSSSLSQQSQKLVKPVVLPVSLSAVEELRLFQVTNMIRVVKRFISGKPNCEYLLLLSSFVERNGLHYRKHTWNKSSLGEACRRLIIERDGDDISSLTLPHPVPLPLSHSQPSVSNSPSSFASSSVAPTITAAAAVDRPIKASQESHSHTPLASSSFPSTNHAASFKQPRPLQPSQQFPHQQLSPHQQLQSLSPSAPSAVITSAATMSAGAIPVSGPSLIYPHGPPPHLLPLFQQQQYQHQQMSPALIPSPAHPLPLPSSHPVPPSTTAGLSPLLPHVTAGKRGATIPTTELVPQPQQMPQYGKSDARFEADGDEEAGLLLSLQDQVRQSIVSTLSAASTSTSTSTSFSSSSPSSSISPLCATSSG